MAKVSTETKELLAVVPLRVKKVFSASPDIDSLIEIVLDLGKPPEARFHKKVFYIKNDIVSRADINYVTGKIGEFTSDNRAGIERTLHRISAIRNRQGKIVGLTLRVGRAIHGTIDIIRDVIESGKNILFLGPPGIGKTTKLREAARVLSDEFDKRVVVVDTSNEIGGDGDIPHPGIGKARRMQVSSPERQHAVMIEAVENHMPEVVIIDEIGTEAEAHAARTIAERGVQLIGTAHGNTLDNILNNPILSDLVGGIQTVILGDEEAKRRHTQKAVLERKAPPTFDIAVEISKRDTFAIYSDVAKAIDIYLRGRIPQGEVRVRTPDGKIEIKAKEKEEMPALPLRELEKAAEEKSRGPLRIYPFGVNRGQLERGMRSLQLPAVAARNFDEADLVLTVKSKARPGSKIVLSAEAHSIPVHVIRKNVSSQIMRFLRYYFKVGNPQEAEGIALREAEEAVLKAKNTKTSVDLSPQNAYVRRLQHQLVERAGLRSESVGEEPKRRLRIYP
ncbi:MAG: AAA family ATPase [Candidatus Saganbacteria bacterium]|nr:AAA family ATPase [Candidatus Saganbacteria bacterium]